MSCVSFLLALALGCSALPLPPHDDAASATEAPSTTALGPRPLTPAHVDAIALAGDDSGIYWTSPANELWVLPAGSPIPVRLASDPGVTDSCSTPTPPLVAASHVFWVAGNRATLHRTRKDGTGDDRIAITTSGNHFTTDGSAIYWTALASDEAKDGSVVLSLREDAAADAAPTALVHTAPYDGISSLAAVGGALYWTPYPTLATIYYADIWAGTVEALAGGGAGAKLPGPQSPYALTSAGGDVLFAFYPDRFTTGLAHFTTPGEPQIVATLPPDDGFLAGLSAAGGWLLATTYPSDYSCGQPPVLHLYATPLAGGAPKLLETALRTPAAAAPQGIVFVDAARRLMALPADQIERTVSPVP